jgi:hypothetical protein
VPAPFKRTVVKQTSIFRRGSPLPELAKIVMDAVEGAEDQPTPAHGREPNAGEQHPKLSFCHCPSFCTRAFRQKNASSGRGIRGSAVIPKFWRCDTLCTIAPQIDPTTGAGTNTGTRAAGRRRDQAEFFPAFGFCADTGFPTIGLRYVCGAAGRLWRKEEARQRKGIVTCAVTVVPRRRKTKTEWSL